MIDIKQLVEDQSISACCYGRFFKEDDAEYALESKGNKLNFFKYCKDEDSFENKTIVFEKIEKKVIKLITVQFMNEMLDHILLIDYELNWFLIRIEMDQLVVVIDEGSLCLLNYASDKKSATDLEKKLEDSSRSVFPIGRCRKMRNFSEIVLSLYNQYLYYFRLVYNQKSTISVESKVFEIRPQSSLNTKSLFKIMDIGFLKGSLSEANVELAVLLQEYVGDYDDSNYSLPAIPHTFLTSFVLDVTTKVETGQVETSRVFSTSAFLKASIGPFSVFNIHPTTTCLEADNFGVLCFSSCSIAYYSKTGIVKEYPLKLGNFNSLLCPCHVVCIKEERKKIRSARYLTTKKFLCQYSNGSFHIIKLSLENSLGESADAITIEHVSSSLEKQNVGDFLLFTHSSTYSQLFISSPFENTQTKWIDIAVKDQNLELNLRNYYDSVGSCIDEEQLPCLGSITQAYLHSFNMTRDTRLVCTSFSGSFNQYTQHIKGAARFSICQSGSRLVPFMPLSENSIIEGSPDLFVLNLKENSLVLFSYDNGTSLFSTMDMAPIEIPALDCKKKKILAVQEFKKTPTSSFFAIVTEVDIGLFEIQYSNFATSCVHVFKNDGDKFMCADIETNGIVFVSRKNQMLQFEIKNRPMSLAKISTNSFENQVSCFYIFTFKGKKYAIVSFWIVNSVYIVEVFTWQIISEKKFDDTIRSCVSYEIDGQCVAILGLSKGKCIITPILGCSIEEEEIFVGETFVNLKKVKTEKGEEAVYCSSNRDMLIVAEESTIDKRRILKTVFTHENEKKRYPGKTISISNITTSQFGECIIVLIEQPEGGAIQFCEMASERKIRWKSLLLKTKSEDFIEPLKSVHMGRAKSYFVACIERSLSSEKVNSLIFKCALDMDTENEFFQEKVISAEDILPDSLKLKEKGIIKSHSICDMTAVQLEDEEVIMVPILSTFLLPSNTESDGGSVILSIAWMAVLDESMNVVKSTILGEQPFPYHNESVFIKIQQISHSDGKFFLIFNNMVHLCSIGRVSKKINIDFIDRYELLDYAKEKELTYPVYAKYFNRGSPVFRSLHFIINSFDIIEHGLDIYLLLCGLAGQTRLIRVRRDFQKVEELLIIDKTNNRMLALSCALIPSGGSSDYEILVTDYIDGDLKVLGLTQKERVGSRKLSNEYKIKDEDRLISANWNQFENTNLYYYIDLLNKESKSTNLSPEKFYLNPKKAYLKNHFLVEAEKGVQYESLVKSTCKQFTGSIKNLIRGCFGSFNAGSQSSNSFVFVTSEGEVGVLSVR